MLQNTEMEWSCVLIDFTGGVCQARSCWVISWGKWGGGREGGVLKKYLEGYKKDCFILPQALLLQNCSVADNNWEDWFYKSNKSHLLPSCQPLFFALPSPALFAKLLEVTMNYIYTTPSSLEAADIQSLQDLIATGCLYR